MRILAVILLPLFLATPSRPSRTAHRAISRQRRDDRTPRLRAARTARHRGVGRVSR